MRPSQLLLALLALLALGVTAAMTARSPVVGVLFAAGSALLLVLDLAAEHGVPPPALPRGAMTRTHPLLETSSAVLGALIAFAFGGWSPLLTLLLTLLAVDYVTGVLAAAYESAQGTGPGLVSRAGWSGLIRKVLVLVMVMLAHLVDQVLFDQSPIFQTAITLAFCANELLSVVENVGRLGVPMPDAVENMVAALKRKSAIEGKVTESVIPLPAPTPLPAEEAP